ncbi:hypothetical protein ASF40_20485 [Microbacterium sp. Leaf288]|uniref:zeta toxin family protein n=1 Tax=Microbacterium sp. Leaf288 TaxID=1736323 RepID=UPI0007017512|nr:zeta toxin family protein [Microbacterium sp. Leaf288]KQP73513.1 hypothetical protein ASF40_20485 [Microbacterium sp. Leaf288]
MTEWTPSEEERLRIFEEQILPVVFPPHPAVETPTLLLLGGQPGAGKSRATSRLLADSPSDMVALSGDDLRAFHPHFWELSRSRSLEAPQILAESTAGWLRSCLAHARTSGRSLLLEGTFHTPEIAFATADLFSRHDFATRAVVVGTPRAESLMSTASRYLLDARAGRASRFTSVAIHDGGWQGTRALVERLDSSAEVDRLTIIDRDGAPRYDAERPDAGGFPGAVREIDRARSVPMPSANAMRWLSELRAMTDYVMTVGKTPEPLAELLVELHQVALQDVLPTFDLPADSRARPALEASLAGRLVTLRQSLPARPRATDLTAPVIPVPQPHRGLSR